MGGEKSETNMLAAVKNNLKIIIFFFLCRHTEEFSNSSEQKRKPQTPTLVILFTQGGMQEF